MDNKQYHKLLAFFIIAVLLLGTVITLLVLMISKPKDVQVNNYVGKDGKSIKGNDGYTPVLGVDYFNGFTPIKGVDYVDGKDSISTNTIIEKQINTQTIVEKTEYVPIKGDTGTQGENGRQLLVQVNYETCELQTKYEGDRIWQIIAQLPIPCEINHDEE